MTCCSASLWLFRLADKIGVRPACRQMGVHHSTYYRWKATIGRSSGHGSSVRPSSGSAPASASIKAGRPDSNGCVERLQLTILEECWRPAFARSLAPRSTALQRDLDEYLRYFNCDRAHTGRLTQARVPADIVFGARKTSTVR